MLPALVLHLNNHLVSRFSEDVKPETEICYKWSIWEKYKVAADRVAEEEPERKA